MNKPTKYKGILFVTNYTDTHKKEKTPKKTSNFLLSIKKMKPCRQ